MKQTIIAIFTAATVLATLVSCSKQDLPYDLEGVEKTVIISINKPAGSGAVLHLDKSDEFEMALTLSQFQGDVSMLEEAQVSAVYTHGSEKKFAHVVTGITSFPTTVKVKMSDVCAKMGISEIETGDKIEFTPSHTLKNGTQVDGWNKYAGFNNTYYSAWTDTEGKAVSYKISYTAFAPYNLSDYLGDFYVDGDPAVGGVVISEIDEYPDPSLLPEGITNDDLDGILLDGSENGWFWGGDVLKAWINKKDYTLIIPDQTIVPDGYGPGIDISVSSASGELDTMYHTISINSTYDALPLGSFGAYAFTFYPAE